MDELKRKAIHFGATEFGKATSKDKRFYVIYNGKKINFGFSDRGLPQSHNTFIDHHDEKKRKAWRARHSMIKLKSGEFAYKNKNQPEFWSYWILWM